MGERVIHKWDEPVPDAREYQSCRLVIYDDKEISMEMWCWEHEREDGEWVGIADVPHEYNNEVVRIVKANHSLRQELARKEGTISRYAESLLLAWGGVCPRDWAIDGDPQSMAEQIRREGDRLQTENNSLNAELARKEEEICKLVAFKESVEKHKSEMLEMKKTFYRLEERLSDPSLSPQADKEGE